MPHAVRDACLGVWFVGMIRGMIRGYDSWVWFVGMIRGPWISVSPRLPCMVIYPQLPPNVSNVGIIPYMERFGAGMLLPLCVRCQSGVRTLGRAWWCRWSAAARCWCRVLLAVRVCVQLERACWWRSGCCCRCCLKVMLEGAAVRVMRVLQTMFWSGRTGERILVEGAAWGCCRASLLMLLQRWCLRVLQGGYVCIQLVLQGC